MKHCYKMAIAILTAIILMLAASPTVMGQFQTPSTVRVGLYYKDSSSNTALSVFNVNAAAGLQAGYFKDNSFTEIYGNPSSETLYVRKDSYYYNSANTLKEYSTSSAATAASYTRYGPYHIKIGSDYPDRESAEEQVAAYGRQGVHAYIAFVEAWQVWNGNYIDSAAAQKDLDAMKAVLGDIGFAVVSPAANRIVLTDAKFQTLCIFGSETAYFRLQPAPENNPPVINIKNKPYRGVLEVRRFSTSDMTVINVVSMQNYLYGNVPAEIGGKSPAEAIKAQAIAAKMYAINNMGKHSKIGFDVCPTTADQVYQGYKCEVAQCNATIDQVLDKVITYNGKLAGAIYYFASSGGRTEDAQNVWGTKYPYLVSVEDKYEKITNWTKTLRASDIKAMFPKLGNILGINITQTAQSGRVTQLAVRGDGSRNPTYYALWKCASVFSLDSQLYTITTDADVYAASLSYVPTANADAADPADRRLLALASAGDRDPAGEAAGSLPGTADGNTTIPTIADGTASEAVSASTKVPDPAQNAGTSDITPLQQTIATTPDAIDLSVRLPVDTKPVKTLLGGKKAATATGTAEVKAVNNKVTILGANGAVRKATLVPETYTFSGRGWGHAVGMSQQGAISMGRAGIKYDQILTHYFTGVQIN